MTPNPARFPVACCLVIVFAALLAACSKRDASVGGRASHEPASAAPAAAAVASQGDATPASERAMRVTVDMSVFVTHRDAAAQGVRAALADLGGYVASGALSGPDASGSASFEVRVPADQVAAFRAAVRALGDVRGDAEKAEDVTEARADLHARLVNARAEETRMLALLADRTGSLADVVAVENEIARVRETIERFEAEERVLSGQVAMATVKVQLETSYVAAEASAGSRLAVAAKEGMDTAWGFLVGTGVFLLSSGPTLGLLLGMLYAIALGVRRVWLAVRWTLGRGRA